MLATFSRFLIANYIEVLRCIVQLLVELEVQLVALLSLPLFWALAFRALKKYLIGIAKNLLQSVVHLLITISFQLFVQASFQSMLLQSQKYRS